MKERRNLVFFVVIFLFVILLGSYFYQVIEGWRFLDALYFVVVTVTTIGYGDLAPITDWGKIFTIFFSFFGIAMAFYAVSLISGYVFKKHIDTKVNQLKEKIKKEQKIKKKRK